MNGQLPEMISIDQQLKGFTTTTDPETVPIVDKILIRYCQELYEYAISLEGRIEQLEESQVAGVVTLKETNE